MKLTGKELMILGAGLLLITIPMAINPNPEWEVFEFVHYFTANYLPVPAGIIFLIGWFKHLYE